MPMTTTPTNAMTRRRCTTVSTRTATNTPTIVNSYMLAVGQRPAAIPRSTIPANSKTRPSRVVERAIPSALAERPGALWASDPATAVAGRWGADPTSDGLGGALLGPVGEPREVHAVRDERDGERGRGTPDEQGAQVTGVHGVPSPEVGSRGATGGLSAERASV